MNNMFTFNNEQFGSIRTAVVNNEVVFVASDVCKALGYTNSRKAIADHVDEDDKGVTKCDTLGGCQTFTAINESGLYSLVLSSKLPQAKQFKHWITSEVLPSIRQTGAYVGSSALDYLNSHPEEIPSFLDMQERLRETEAENRELRENYDNLQGNYENLQGDYKKLNTVKTRFGTQLRNTRANLWEARREISENADKVEYFNSYLDSSIPKTTSEVAALLGFRSAQELNKFLEYKGVIKWVGNSWVLRSDYVELGIAKVIATSGCQELRWTPKGEYFIYTLVHSNCN